MEEYMLVCTLDNGLPIYKKQNETGGWTYYGMSCGIPAVIWVDGVGERDELIAIAKDCYNLELTNVKI